MNTDIIKAEAFDLVHDPLDLTSKHEPRATTRNIALVLNGLGDRIRLEEFTGRITCSGLESIGLPDGEWSDVHTTRLVMLCEERKLEVSFERAQRAVVSHAREHAYNVLTNFALECAAAWDGVARVDTAFSTYWGAEDSPALRITARVFFLSLLARALSPGEKVDTCVTLFGPQGALKSTSLRELAGDPWFADSPLPIGDKDAQQLIRGTWIWEFAENASLSRREAEQNKAFLSQKDDRFRASYAVNVERVPRQTCFVATTNREDILRDATGNRRFLIVRTGDAIDIAGIRRDRLQLLGEAARRVIDDEDWWPSREDDRLLDAVRADHEERDPWEEPIRAFVWERGMTPRFGMPELLARLGVTTEKQSKREQNRAADVLRAMGLRSERHRGAGRDRDKFFWVPGPGWVPPDEGEWKAWNAKREAERAASNAWQQRLNAPG